jgi:methylmalonyl-CoA/ethylmalonyl-CoA epimerase
VDALFAFISVLPEVHSSKAGKTIKRGDPMGKKRAEKSTYSNLDHVGVVVKDMDKTIQYLSSLGIGPFEPPISDPALAEKWFRGEPSDWKVKIRYAKMGPVKLELIQPVEGKNANQEFLEKKGEGIQHIGFTVDDLDREVDKLTTKGIEVIMRMKKPGGQSVYLETDAIGGILIELMQR